VDLGEIRKDRLTVGNRRERWNVGYRRQADNRERQADNRETERWDIG
jgi:hypothetical protein